MGTPVRTDAPTLAPIFAGTEADDLRCLDFHRSELARLHERGLIPGPSFETVAAEIVERREAIRRRGQARAELTVSQSATPHDPSAAALWAERARQTDPSWPDPWLRGLEIERRRGRFDEAIALCEEAAGRFPAFPVTPDDLRREQADRAAAAEDTTPLARAALQRGDDAGVIDLCTKRLNAQPDHFDSIVLLAFACQRQERLDQALALYRRLTELQPENDVWRTWVETITRRLAASPKRPAPRPVTLAPTSPRVAAPAEPTVPRITLSEVAAEFLQDHWQKLFLCLAVLLIVVASNVMAYQLLGPEKLWSPAGKCILGLVYTAMFAAFGSGLTWWGAGRAGRIMLLTALIVVPANFMLAGQMRLLSEPTAPGLVLLGLDAAALFLLIRAVARSLGIQRGAWTLSSALFVLGAFNAAAAPGVPWPWAWQFAVFLAPSAVFLAAVAWLTTWYKASTEEGQLEVTYGALGLFAFAFLTGVARTGGFVLDLLPTLYAIPVMATGVACVVTSLRAERLDPDTRRTTFLRFGGLVATGLAFALALARPPGVSPLFSGNTLATALVGLVLYAALLWRERHPAYLYLGFAALFLAYFGAFFFVVDLVHAVEEAARQALGYREKLPLPFKSINGLVFNSVLALLAVAFKRRWRDERLAWHCHAIGLPFSIACGVFSGFEPKAAVICLSGYAVLYTIAVRLFAEPRLIYLSAAALAGASYFGSGLVPGVTLAEQALLASLIGLAEWGVAAAMKAAGAVAAYRRPLVHAALAMCALAVVGASASAVESGSMAFAASTSFLVVALVAVLANRELPDRSLAYLAAFSGSLGYAFLALSAGERWWGGLSPAQFAVAVASAGLGLSWLADRSTQLVRAGNPSESLAAYPVPLTHAAFVQTGLAVLYCVWHVLQKAPPRPPDEYVTLAAAFAVAGAGLAVLGRPVAHAALAHLSLLCGLGVWLGLAQVALGGALRTPSEFAAATGGYLLLVLAAGEALRALRTPDKKPDPDFATPPTPRLDLFRGALPEFLLGLTVFTVFLAVVGLENSLATAFTMAACAAAVLGATRDRRSEPAVEVGLVFAVLSALSLTAWRLDAVGRDELFSGLALTSAACAVLIWGVAAASGRTPGGSFYAPPCVRTALRITWAVFALALAGPVVSSAAYTLSAPALCVNTAALLLLTTLRPRPSLTYRAIVSLVFAVYVVVLSVGKGSPETAHVPGMIAVGLGLLLEFVGFAGRWREREGWEGLYLTPLFRSALVLTSLGAAASYWSPASMVLAGLAYLVLVKGLPSRNWLYPAVVSWCVALYFGFLVTQPPDRLVAAAVVLAYLFWAVGLSLRRFEPALVRVLRLPESGYDAPVFRLAVAASLVAVLLRMVRTYDGPLAWTDSAGLAWSLALFSLLMTRADPRGRWVHAGVLLATTGVVMSAYPRVALESPLWWLPIGMAAAVVWQWSARGARWFLERAGGRLGLGDAGHARVFDLWSRAFFAVSFAAVTGVVLLGVYGSVFGSARAGLSAPAATREWYGPLLALVLGGVYVTSRSWAADRVGVWKGLGVLFVLAVWWAGAVTSPLSTYGGLDGGTFLPPATATLALGFVASGLGLIGRPGPREAFWEREVRAEASFDDDPGFRLDTFNLRFGYLLALIGPALTLGLTRPVTPATFLVAASALGLASVSRRWVSAAYACGVVLCASGVSAALLAAKLLAVTSGADRVVLAALGLVAAVTVLGLSAGVLRRRDPSAVDPVASDPTDFPAYCVAVALEQVALIASVFCAAGVCSTLLFPTRPADRAAAEGVGVLVALTVLAAGLLTRWRVTWLVYAAQSSLLGSYLYYRWAFPLPAATDAVVLTLFGYLDFGLAEAMQRVGLGRYAGPTRRFALAVPVVPLALAFLGGPLGDSKLFLLFASATFYGVACARLQSKTVGYAAAVLYNAALWVLWSQVGWTVTDRPQFFLVPVGLSAVLFAEVNRQTFGRQVLNAIRGVGLSTVYLSLALPTWQFASLWAWLALLLLSLAGIFAGIGLRVQTFLWLGLSTFVLDVVYQLGRVGAENTLAKWGIMLALGILLVVFVALNEKKQILATMRDYFEAARGWE